MLRRRVFRFVAFVACVLGAACAVSCLAAQVVAGRATDLARQAQPSASASAGNPGQKYGPQDAIDDNEGSWWAAYIKNLPVRYELRFPQPQRVDTLVLLNADNPAIYSHIKHLTISFSAGEALEQELPNERGPFLLRFPARQTELVRLTITQVHEPDKIYVGIATLSAYYDPDQQVRVKMSPRDLWKKIELTARGRPEHPCVYHTPEDVKRARERMEKEPWAAAYAKGILAQADAAVARPDDFYLQHLPEKGACFAYGFTGCPICKASWGTWGGANCSWDNPRHVVCRNGHILPDAEHPDPGTGYKAPDGRIHYFIGSWNAWVTEQYIHNMAGPCALAYALTGDEKYARKAAFILDAIASIYPYCDKGSWDYPSDPPSGRLARPWYQVARVLVRLVDFVDLIYNSPSLDEPSIVPGLTRRQNIERNMLLDGAQYCYTQSLAGGLHNGEADYVRGVLAVGCLLGIESYVDWAYIGPYGILSLVHNNLCRDGRYYETSLMYEDHTRELYLSFAEPLWNYRSEKYPQGVNLYADPVFQSFYLLPAATISMLGHAPRYGDSAPDLARVAPPRAPQEPFDLYLTEILYARAPAAVREDFRRLLQFMTEGDILRGREGLGSGYKEWLLFHAAPAAEIASPPARPAASKPTLPDWLAQRLQGSNFFGQKGLILLRTPFGPQAQAALIRFGPSLNHGHLDDLNLNYYALGYELTYDLGYSLGSTHTQVGWAKQTASHNLVMIDEKPQGPDPKTDGSGGSLHLFAAFPSLQVAESSAELTYKSLGVTEYRRLCALVGEGPDSYLLDIFHVTGGRQHDYIFHALSKNVDFTGVTLGPPAEGSLAGPDIKWGALQGNDGDIIGFPGKPYWNPPPGNGFGFLMEPQRAPVTGPISAVWHIGTEDCHLRMTMLSEPDTELITAWAPGIYPETVGAYGSPAGFPRSRYVLFRRRGEAPLQSAFIAVYEPYAKPPLPGIYDYEALAAVAEITNGEKRPIPSVRVLFFKATGPNDELRLPLKVEKSGRYLISAGVYGSPAYGVAQLSLDGQPLQPLLNEPGTTPPNATGHFSLGTHHLTAGRHLFSLRVIQPKGENYWIGLQYIALTPETEAEKLNAAAQPFLARIERLPAPPEAVAVRVLHVNGGEDILLYNRQIGRLVVLDNGRFASDGYFTRWRCQGERLMAVQAVGASRLRALGQALRPSPPNLAGTVTRLDYARNLVYTDAALPTDDVYKGLPIYFSNLDYSRNTVYRIAKIARQGRGSVIDLGRTSLVLGVAELEDDPLDANRLSTLTPHEYARALGGRDSLFFQGKLCVAEGGQPQTIIRATQYGQPFILHVDNTEGFRQGMRVYYYDLRPGDRFVVYNQWQWTPADASRSRLPKGRTASPKK